MDNGSSSLCEDTHRAADGLVVVPRDDDSRSFSDSLLPDAMIRAGMAVQDQVDADNANYIAGETTDWDQGMIAVAIYRAMIAATQQPAGEGETDLASDVRAALLRHTGVTVQAGLEVEALSRALSATQQPGRPEK